MFRLPHLLPLTFPPLLNIDPAGCHNPCATPSIIPYMFSAKRWGSKEPLVTGNKRKQKNRFNSPRGAAEHERKHQRHAAPGTPYPPGGEGDSGVRGDSAEGRGDRATPQRTPLSPLAAVPYAPHPAASVHQRPNTRFLEASTQTDGSLQNSQECVRYNLTQWTKVREW